VAKQRQCDPPKLAGLIRGDLDWIVMKTLEKDRNRRYETANGLAADLRRFLDEEPVVARPPSAGYRLGNSCDGTRTGFGGSVVLMALLGGIIGTTWGLVRAEKARQAEANQRAMAEEERKFAEERKQQAVASEKKALAQTQVAEAVRNFLERDLLRQADPTGQADAVRQLGSGFEPKDNPTIKELLDRAAMD